MVRNQGFTLIEIMIVVFILSIVIGFVSLSISSSQLESKDHQFQAEKLRTIMDALQTKAIIQATPYAITVRGNQALIAKYVSHNASWIPVNDYQLQLKLARDIQLSLRADTGDRVLFYADGQMSKFTLSATKKNAIVFECGSEESVVLCHV